MDLQARPAPLPIEPTHTALVIIDMQNAFLTKGGLADQLGVDISWAPDVIAGVAEVLQLARAAGLTIVHVQNGWDAQYDDAGGPLSPNRQKSAALKLMAARPELAGQFLARGTRDYAIVDELTPARGEIVVNKTRYSAFLTSNIDAILRSHGIRTLIFAGVAQNVCVETSLRDAFHLEYHCVLLEDATHHVGPDFVRAATLFNVETFFGWVANKADLAACLRQKALS